MSEILERTEREIAKQRELRRALCRWVAAIREALLNEIRGSPSRRYPGAINPPTDHQLEIIKRDLNQCERMLTIPYIEYIDTDPVLEIWRKDSERAGVLWFDFDPENEHEHRGGAR